jgi:hypothetical protein
MAPNRKSLSALAQTLNGLELVSSVQSKYLPLTHPLETGSQCTECASPAVYEDESSYWDWSSDDDVVEPTLCVLSSESIVSNLIQTGHAVREQVETNPEHDSYWSESPATHSTTSDEMYWSWETHPSRVAQLIMATTHSTYQQGEREHERVVRVSDEEVPRAAAACHGYWHW